MTSTCRNAIFLIWNRLQDNEKRRHGHVGDVIIEIVVTVTLRRKSNSSKTIYSILPQLQKIDKQKQGAILNQVFFTSKSDELINILSDAEPQEKLKAFTILSLIDPANSLKYEILKRSR